MASYQNVVSINIIMKFLIGRQAFVSLCTLSHSVLLSLTSRYSACGVAYSIELGNLLVHRNASSQY